MSPDDARRDLFPLPAIPPPHLPRSSSRRLWQRYRFAAATTKLANGVVRSVNSLSSSFTAKAEYLACQQASNHSTKRHQRLTHQIYAAAARFVRRRGAPVPVSDDFLDIDAFACQSPSPSSLPYESNRPVLPIVASRVSLPSQAGTSDLLSLLPPHIANYYRYPSASLMRSAAASGPACVCLASHADYVHLVERMLQLRMLELTTSPVVVNGLFGVDKGGDAIRLIIDARRANSCFAEPPPVQLPTPEVTARLQVPLGHRLFVTKIDLDNFYHRLQLPAWMRPYFALPPLRASELTAASTFPPDALVYPCCCTLPMGWSHSVFLAQTAHEHILDTRTTLLRAPDRLSLSANTVVDRLRHQLYVDDLLLFELDSGTRSVEAVSEYSRAIAASGLAVKLSKVEGPSDSGVECLGLEVHGRELTVGLSPVRLHRLCCDTSALLNSNYCTGSQMQRIVGHWTWAALVHRPAFAVFNAVYRFIACARHKRFHIWPVVARELRAIIGLAPLLYASLGQPWCPKVIATDASLSGLGVVSTVVPPQTVAAIASVPRSRTAPTPLPPLFSPSRTHWATIASAAWRRPEHINVLELRSLITSVRWLLSSPHYLGHQLLIFSDSSTTVGSVCKGRSSSYSLLCRLRVLSALCLASGLRLHMFWIRSADNPADVASRAFQ